MNAPEVLKLQQWEVRLVHELEPPHNGDAIIKSVTVIKIPRHVSSIQLITTISHVMLNIAIFITIDIAGLSSFSWMRPWWRSWVGAANL